MVRLVRTVVETALNLLEHSVTHAADPVHVVKSLRLGEEFFHRSRFF